MRLTWVLVIALGGTLAACESSNNGTRYGLTGDNTSERAMEYSDTRDANGVPSDAPYSNQVGTPPSRSWSNNEQLDQTPMAPSHSVDMPR